MCKTKTCTDFGQMHNLRKCVRDCLLLHHGTQTQRRDEHDEPQPVSSILKIPFLVQGHANQCHMFFSHQTCFEPIGAWLGNAPEIKRNKLNAEPVKWGPANQSFQVGYTTYHHVFFFLDDVMGRINRRNL